MIWGQLAVFYFENIDIRDRTLELGATTGSTLAELYGEWKVNGGIR